jgi:flap endonuclease-1
MGSLLRGREIELTELKGRKIAIDAFNTLYQFLTIIRDRMTGKPLMDSKGHVTSHISGLFYRTTRLLEAGIQPIFVFDGMPPHFKKTALAARAAIKEAAEVRLSLARETGDQVEIMKAAKMTARLNGEMINHAKELLTYMGVTWIQAPSEGEAQCSWMCNQGLVYATASQDWDSFLFGSPRLLRNVSVSAKRKIPKTGAYIEVRPELLELKEVLSAHGINREQLIALAMLIGTDYNPGVHGIGPKTALKIVKEKKTLDKIIEKASEKNPWIGPEPREIFDFYMNPPAEEKVKLEPPRLDAEKLRYLMVDTFEFSGDRIDKAIKTLESFQPKAKSLSSWVR